MASRSSNAYVGIQRRPLANQPTNQLLPSRGTASRTHIGLRPHALASTPPPGADSDVEFRSDSTVTFAVDSPASQTLMASVAPRPFYTGLQTSSAAPLQQPATSASLSSRPRQLQDRSMAPTDSAQQVQQLSRPKESPILIGGSDVYYASDSATGRTHRPPSLNQSATSTSTVDLSPGASITTPFITRVSAVRKGDTAPLVLGVPSAHDGGERLTAITALTAKEKERALRDGGVVNKMLLKGALRSSSFSAQSTSSAVSLSSSHEAPMAINGIRRTSVEHIATGTSRAPQDIHAQRCATNDATNEGNILGGPSARRYLPPKLSEDDGNPLALSKGSMKLPDSSTAALSPVNYRPALNYQTTPHPLAAVIMGSLRDPSAVNGSAGSFPDSVVASWILGNTSAGSYIGDAKKEETPQKAMGNSGAAPRSPDITPYRTLIGGPIGGDARTLTFLQEHDATPSSQANADSSHTISPQNTPGYQYVNYFSDGAGATTPRQDSSRQQSPGLGAGDTEEDRKARETILSMLLSGSRPVSGRGSRLATRRAIVDQYDESDDDADDGGTGKRNAVNEAFDPPVRPFHPITTDPMPTKSYHNHYTTFAVAASTVAYASALVNTSATSASSSQVTIHDDLNALQYTSTRDRKRMFVDSHGPSNGVGPFVGGGSKPFSGVVEHLHVSARASAANRQVDPSLTTAPPRYENVDQNPNEFASESIQPRVWHDEVVTSVEEIDNSISFPRHSVLQYGPPKVSDITRKMYESLFDQATLEAYPADLMLWRMRAQSAGLDPYAVPAQSLERAATKRSKQTMHTSDNKSANQGINQSVALVTDEDPSFISNMTLGDSSAQSPIETLLPLAVMEVELPSVVAAQQRQATTQYISAESRASFWTRRRTKPSNEVGSDIQNARPTPADLAAYSAATSAASRNASTSPPRGPYATLPQPIVESAVMMNGPTAASPTRKLYASPPSINYSAANNVPSKEQQPLRGRLSFAAEYYTDPYVADAAQRVLGPMISPNAKGDPRFSGSRHRDGSTGRGSISPLDPRVLESTLKGNYITDGRRSLTPPSDLIPLRTTPARSATATPERSSHTQHYPLVLSPSGLSERSYVPPSNLLDLNVTSGALVFSEEDRVSKSQSNQTTVSQFLANTNITPEDAAILYDLYRMPTYFVSRHPPSPGLRADVTQMDDLLTTCRSVRGVARGERGIQEAKEAAIRASSMVKLFDDIGLGERREREEVLRLEGAAWAALKAVWDQSQKSLVADELLRADSLFRQRLWEQQDSERLLITLTFTTNRLRIERSESVANEIRNSQFQEDDDRYHIETEEARVRAQMLGSLFTLLVDALVFEEGRHRATIAASSHSEMRYVFEVARAEREQLELVAKAKRRATIFHSARFDVEEEEAFQRQAIIDQSMAHWAHLQQVALESQDDARRRSEARQRLKAHQTDQREDMDADEGYDRTNIATAEAAARLALSRQFLLSIDLRRVEAEESEVRRQMAADQLSYRADLVTSAAKSRNSALKLQGQREAAEAQERALQEKKRRAQKARPFIGLTLAERMIEGRLSPTRGGSSPLVIDALTIGGPAHRKGLALGDIVISVAGELAMSLLQVRGIMAKRAIVGETIEIVVRKPSAPAANPNLPKRRATVGGEYLERELGNSPQLGARSAGTSTIASLNDSMASLKSSASNDNGRSGGGGGGDFMSSVSFLHQSGQMRSPLDLDGSFADGNASLASGYEGTGALSAQHALPPARTFIVPVMTADEEFVDLTDWYFDINKHKQITRDTDPSVVLRSVCSFKAKQSSAQSAAATAAAVAAMTGLQPAGSATGSRSSTPTSRPRSTSFGGHVAVPEFGVFVREESTQSGWNNSTSAREAMVAAVAFSGHESMEPSPRRASAPMPVRLPPSPASTASTSPTSIKSGVRASISGASVTSVPKISLTSPPNRTNSGKDINAPLSHRTPSKVQLLAKPTPSRRPSSTATPGKK